MEYETVPSAFPWMWCCMQPVFIPPCVLSLLHLCTLCLSLTLPSKCPTSDIVFLKRRLEFRFVFFSDYISNTYSFIGDNLENNIQEHICFQSFLTKPCFKYMKTYKIYNFAVSFFFTISYAFPHHYKNYFTGCITSSQYNLNGIFYVLCPFIHLTLSEFFWHF